MNSDVTRVEVLDSPAPEKTPQDYNRWLKNQIRRGKMPRYTIRIVKVKTGEHPKQHRLDFRLTSTFHLLARPVLA